MCDFERFLKSELLTFYRENSFEGVTAIAVEVPDVAWCEHDNLRTSKNSFYSIKDKNSTVPTSESVEVGKCDMTYSERHSELIDLQK